MISVRYKKLLWIWLLVVILCWIHVPGTAKAGKISGRTPKLMSIQSNGSSVSLYGSEPLNITTFQLLDPLRLVVDIPLTEVGGNIDKKMRGNNNPVVKIVTREIRKNNNLLTRVEIYLSRLVPHMVNELGNVVEFSFENQVSLSDAAMTDFQKAGAVGNDKVSGSYNVAQNQRSDNMTQEPPTSGLITQNTSEVSNLPLNDEVSMNIDSAESEPVQDNEFDVFAEDSDSSSQSYYADLSPTDSGQGEHVNTEMDYGSGDYDGSNAGIIAYQEQADPNPEAEEDYYQSNDIVKGNGEERKNTTILRTSSIKREEVEYSGQPMTLDIVDADIVKIFTQMTALAGKNIVVDPDVRGDITLRMENAPWDQILSYILKVHDLGIEEEGNVIRIAKRSKLKRERDEARLLKEAEKLAKETRTEIIYLSYARSQEMSSKIRPILSSRGDLIVDTRTNSLIITDIPEYLEGAKKLIATLDIKNRQVTVQAQIVSSKKSFSRSLGIQWGGGFRFGPDTGNPGKYSFPYWGGVSDNTYISDVSPFAFNFPPTDNSVPFMGLVFGNVMDTFRLHAALHAAESEGMTRIVANPQITTQDNVQANIQSGVEIPFPVLTDRGVTTEFRPATISLVVTPHITVDDNISMRIRVTNNAVDRSFSPPGTILNTAQTELLVGDGDTFVIGGLNQTEAGTSSKQFPYLHRIPIIGKLFKSYDVGNTFSDLLIFITPQIVIEEEAEEVKTKQLDVMQKEYIY